MRVHLFIIAGVLVLLAGLALPVVAQDAVTFVDVPLEGDFVVTLPEDWPVWRQADYDDLEEADSAAVALLNTVYPDAGLTTPFIRPEMKLLATPPDATTSGMFWFTVEMIRLGDLVPGATADETTVNDLAGALGEVTVTERHNRRPVAFSDTLLGDQPLLYATTLFPTQDTVAVVSMTAPEDALDDALATFVLSTLRLTGEPIPGAAYLALMGKEVPENWTLPADVVYVPVECQLVAGNNVNLRGGPGTGFPVQGVLASGTRTDATGQATGRDGMVWFQTADGLWARIDVVVEDATCTDLPVVDTE
jgi:hypothetical protein